MISIRAEAQEAREGLRLLDVDDKKSEPWSGLKRSARMFPIVAPLPAG
jgi:hypothetical protein